MKRKISAILSADVVGYSKLMGTDEMLTVQTMESYRGTLASLIDQHHGHVVDSPGDNLMAEFPSVVDSVQCAVEIQHVIKAKNAVLPEVRRMEFRIGIHLGDVIEEKDRLYGDGVNIAARIEGIADAGGICISDSAYQQIKSKLSLGYEDLGEHSVKNITDPVRVYRIPLGSGSGAGTAQNAGVKRWRNVAIGAIAVLVVVVGALLVPKYTSGPPSPQEATTQEPAASAKSELSLTEKPSIAILPFDDLSGDEDQQYFADGMSEEIISRLSMNSMLDVIARNSSFFYRGGSVNIRQIGTELGARYVVEGSVRKAEAEIRITVQLIDAESGDHLWSKTYSGELQDVFSLQEDIAQQIVAELNVVYAEAELSRVRRIPTDSLSAYDAFLRGYDYFENHGFERDANAKAREYFEKSIELDPEYSAAYSMLGNTYWMDYFKGYDTDPAILDRAMQLAQTAISMDVSDPEAHYLMSMVYHHKRQYEHALTEDFLGSHQDKHLKTNGMMS